MRKVLLEEVFDAGVSAELFAAYGVFVDPLFTPKRVVETPFPGVCGCAIDSVLKGGLRVVWKYLSKRLASLITAVSWFQATGFKADVMRHSWRCELRFVDLGDGRCRHSRFCTNTFWAKRNQILVAVAATSEIHCQHTINTSPQSASTLFFLHSSHEFLSASL
jgi:hypothetical protein